MAGEVEVIGSRSSGVVWQPRRGRVLSTFIWAAARCTYHVVQRIEQGPTDLNYISKLSLCLTQAENRYYRSKLLNRSGGSRTSQHRHQFLTKAQSSLLTQIPTGHIGLPEYLMQRHRVTSPACQCGHPEETAEHVILDCPEGHSRPPAPAAPTLSSASWLIRS